MDDVRRAQETLLDAVKGLGSAFETQVDDVRWKLQVQAAVLVTIGLAVLLLALRGHQLPNLRACRARPPRARPAVTRPAPRKKPEEEEEEEQSQPEKLD